MSDDFSLQLHCLSSFACLASSFINILVLCALMMLAILIVHEYESFTVFLLKSLVKGCCLGKIYPYKVEKLFSDVGGDVFTIWGLNHIIFLPRFRYLLTLWCSSGSYFNSSE